MKLQLVFSQETNGVKYYKYVLNPPKEVVDALKWEEGQELTATMEKGTMVIRAGAPPKSS